MIKWSNKNVKDFSDKEIDNFTKRVDENKIIIVYEPTTLQPYWKDTETNKILAIVDAVDEYKQEQKYNE